MGKHHIVKAPPNTSSQLVMGGNGGGAHSITNGGAGQSLAIYYNTSDNVLRALWINGVQYGGSGGDKQVDITLPSDGVLTLEEVWCRDNDSYWEVSYFLFNIAGTQYMVGDPNNRGDVGFVSNLPVIFSSLRCGQEVDQLQFTVMTKS